MRIIDCEQGSETWLEARAFLPTSSHADEIMTPSRLKASGSQPKYMSKLLAEWIFGHWIDFDNKGPAMERGNEQEDQARAWYELEYGVDVEQVGLIVTDDGRFGCSPDGLVGSEGMTEIKVPLLHTHILYLAQPEELEKEYHGQTQVQMATTERGYVDLVSYHHKLPKVVRRVEPDADYQKAWKDVLGAFLDSFDEAKRKLAAHRMDPDRSPLPGQRSTLLDQLERSLEVAHG